MTLVAADPYESFHGVGGRNVQVQMFQWKWSNVANECENFLSKYDYGGVQVQYVNVNTNEEPSQVSPPNEHIRLMKNGDMPWWIDYQPVSYNIVSRRGSRSEFQDMITRCNKAGVR